MNLRFLRPGRFLKPPRPLQPPRPSLLGAGALLLISSTVVNAGNYGYNLLLGRWLGPAAFADLSFAVTLMLVLTLVTGTIQTVVARFAAGYAADGDSARLDQLRRWLTPWAWGVGALSALLLGALSPLLAAWFRLSSAWPLLILAAGLPVYFALGVSRGLLQGRTRFGRLAFSYQAEMWARLLAGVALVALGWGVGGAVLGLSLSFVAAWAAALPIPQRGQGDRGAGGPGDLSGGGVSPEAPLPNPSPTRGEGLLRRQGAETPPSPRPGEGDRGEVYTSLPLAERRRVLLYAGPVAVALLGQIVVNNSDVLLVKALFAPAAAGLYAALALIGRIVFFATWSVVTALFPVVAQRQQRGEPHRGLLGLGLGLVAGAGLPIVAGAWLWPDAVVRLLFGADYLAVAPLLWLYALATTLYALANVVVSYRLALGQGGGAWLVLLGGVAQVAAIARFHATLDQVVLAQAWAMAGLLALLLAWDGWLWLREGAYGAAALRRLRALPWRSIFGALLGLALLLGGGWRLAFADAPGASHPAQAQVKRLLPSLIDSEAERASGAYVPGVGAVIAIDLLRGPNTAPGQPAHVGTRDWAIYLVQTFGPQLGAVPPDETIAFSIDYYDFASVSYHQLVVTARAADVADPSRYTIWLNGRPYDAATAAEVRP